MLPLRCNPVKVAVLKQSLRGVQEVKMFPLTKFAILSALVALMLFAVGCDEESSPPYTGSASAGDVAAAARMAAEAVNQESGIPGQGIIVSGSGTASAEPDLALINLGVQVLSPSVGEALNTANSSLDDILQVLANYDVDESDTQTRYFNINTQYDYSNDGAPEVTGYQVTNELSVRVRNLDSLGELITDVVEAGGDPVRVNGINFAIEDTAALEDEALALAVEDAKARAQRMAELSGVTLGDLVSVSQAGGASPALPAAFAAEAAVMSRATPIRAGDLEITINIQALYTIK